MAKARDSWPIDRRTQVVACPASPPVTALSLRPEPHGHGSLRRQVGLGSRAAGSDVSERGLQPGRARAPRGTAPDLDLPLRERTREPVLGTVRRLAQRSKSRSANSPKRADASTTEWRPRWSMRTIEKLAPNSGEFVTPASHLRGVLIDTASGRSNRQARRRGLLSTTGSVPREPWAPWCRRPHAQMIGARSYGSASDALLALMSAQRRQVRRISLTLVW